MIEGFFGNVIVDTDENKAREIISKMDGELDNPNIDMPEPPDFTTGRLF